MGVDAFSGEVPLGPEVRKWLVAKVTLPSELKAAESRNIASALEWAFKSRKLKKQLLTIDTLCFLHERMFDQTWKWAGHIRLQPSEIGASSDQIKPKLKVLTLEVTKWIDQRAYSAEEVAVRFHHRLLKIHPFENGNARFARLAADLLLDILVSDPLNWGFADLTEAGPARERYIAALKAADAGNYDELIAFAKSK